MVGIESIENIVMMEDHNQAYLAWKEAGLKRRILVHIDAHIDFAWIADRDPLEILQAQRLGEVERMLKDRLSWNLSRKRPQELIGIGNYIYPAMREGIVKEFYWVVPGPMWESPRERRLIKRYLKGILNSGLAKQQKILETGEGLITTKICDMQITVCSLSCLPEFAENVLLDIDVDFLVTETSSPLYRNPEGARPWLGPEELINRLREKKVKTDFVTIAYSVEGGFTPLKYKYLGDDLRALFRNADLVRKEDASSHYNSALLFYEKKLYEQAKCAYQRAVALDPTYKTEYNNYGPVYEKGKLWKRAEQEYIKALKLDADNANAHRGLGNVYAGRKSWPQAISNYNRAIQLNGKNYKPHYNLGYVYTKMGRYDQAIAEFEKSLQMKPDEGNIYRWLGLLYAKKGKVNEAIKAYKRSLHLGIYSPLTHFKLFWLYLAQRKIYKAIEEFKMCVKLFTGELFSYVKIR